VQVAAGSIGAPPTNGNQPYEYSVRATGRLTNTTEFANIILRTTPDGGFVKVSDVGRVTLGAENYAGSLWFDGRDGVGLGVLQLQTGNALQVSKQVRETLDRLSRSFPARMSYHVAFDTTEFVSESIKEVVITLLDRDRAGRAGDLPVLAGLAHHADPRAHHSDLADRNVLPDERARLLDQPAHAVRADAGDGSGRRRRDRGDREHRALHPREGDAAARGRARSDAEIQGAVVASSLVLLAVFVPVAFFPGTTGQLYKQFALTIACSITISLFCALTLTPVLSSLLLGRTVRRESRFFRPVNRAINATRAGYRRVLPRVIAARMVVLGVFALLLAFTGWSFTLRRPVSSRTKTKASRSSSRRDRPTHRSTTRTATSGRSKRSSSSSPRSPTSSMPAGSVSRQRLELRDDVHPPAPVGRAARQ
jgi:HAE1 family hydrophobic/amphiphilic exporter-1